MAHFYAEITGSRGSKATKTATKADGMTAHVRGWDIGVSLWLHQDRETGEDVIEVEITGGSHNPKTLMELARIKEGTATIGGLITELPKV